MSIPTELRHLIAERDHYRCRYRLTTEENCGLQMHLDHIIPQVAGGETTSDNLCLVCFSCNVYKGVKQTGIDPVTQVQVELFHPLHQKWREHFAWNKGKTGLTPRGRQFQQN